MLAARENSWAATPPTLLTGRAGAGPAPDSTAMRRHQLVPGVENRPGSGGLGDQALDANPPAGLDTADVPAPEPDHREAATAVVQLRDQGRDAGPGAQGDGSQRAADHRLLPKLELIDRRTAQPDGFFALLLGVHLMLRRHEAGQRTPQPGSFLLLTHLARVSP